ncbi:MAG: hypothetical protein R3A78_00580 [Polyangiales bacterium]|nr:hypothetical protein [Myxococcales bacterium]
MLVIGAAVVAVPLLRAVPTESRIRYGLGPDHADVHDVRLVYALEGDDVQHATFHWPEGAPKTFDHVVSLSRGRYTLRAELRDATGDHAIDRTLELPAEGTVHVDLFDMAYAAVLPSQSRRDGVPHPGEAQP